MNPNDISLIKNDHFLQTKGLMPKLGYELRLLIASESLNPYERILNYLVKYILNSDRNIQDDETIAYHSWLLKFNRVGDSFEIFEACSDGSGFNKGVEYAVKVVSTQEELCFNKKEPPIFPLFSQKIVILEGVYEGYPIEGVRYPSPEHMTGWCLTTDLLNGDTNMLKPVHYFHVAFKRPDILEYLALPFGYRFNLGKESDVDIWFDAEAIE